MGEKVTRHLEPKTIVADALGSECSSVKGQLAEKERNVGELLSKIDDKEREKSELQALLATAQSKVDEHNEGLLKQIKQLSEEKTSFVERIEQLRKENSELNDLTSHSEQEMRMMRADLELDITTKAEELVKLGDLFERETTKAHRLDEKLAEAKQELENVILEKCQLEENKEQVEKEVVALRDRGKNLETERTE